MAVVERLLLFLNNNYNNNIRAHQLAGPQVGKQPPQWVGKGFRVEKLLHVSLPILLTCLLHEKR